MAIDYIDLLNYQFTLRSESSALLVIDVQYASGSRKHGLGQWLKDRELLDSASYRFDRIENTVVPSIQRLLQHFRSNGLQVIYITLGASEPDYSDAPVHMRSFFKATNNHSGSFEHRIIEELAPLPGEVILNKTTQGAFASSRIDQVLRAKGVTQVIATGVSTNNCVETTAREASDRGYNVVMVSDATGTCSDTMQDLTLNGFTRLWGRVLSVEQVISELSTQC
jgi:nicotinamidase-related amidase